MFVHVPPTHHVLHSSKTQPPGKLQNIKKSWPIGDDERNYNNIRFLVWIIRFWVVSTALLQFPLHLYMVIALKVGNEPHLEAEGDSENTWGFGQVVALVLVIPVLRECIKGRIGKGPYSLI
jgi:hypothetical protein